MWAQGLLNNKNFSFFIKNTHKKNKKTSASAVDPRHSKVELAD